MPLPHRLRKHADYQHAYAHSAKGNSRQITYFFSVRPATRRSPTAGARVGLTVPKAIGKAHERNRIKRRLRGLIRSQLSLLRSPLDVILHPRRAVLTADFPALEREIAEIFTRVQAAVDARHGEPFPARPPHAPRGSKSRSPKPSANAAQSPNTAPATKPRRPQPAPAAVPVA